MPKKTVVRYFTDAETAKKDELKKMVQEELDHIPTLQKHLNEIAEIYRATGRNKAANHIECVANGAYNIGVEINNLLKYSI